MPQIKRPRAPRQPGHRLHGCIESPRKRPWPAGPAGWRGEVSPGQESRPGRVFTNHEARNTRHGFSAFHKSRTVRPFGPPWERKGRIMKNRRPITVSLRPFARHGAASRGMARHRAASRGKVRPEPVSAHRPHRQHGLLDFHETRDTKHESRLFCFSQITIHGCTVLVACQRFPTISRYFPLFPGKKMCRKSSVLAHRGSRVIGFMDASSRRASAPGLQVPPAGEAKYLRVKNHGLEGFSRITRHETRDTAFLLFTNHGLYGRSGRHGRERVAS